MLDVGFGRRLHVPQQLSGHQVVEAEGADSHDTLPAAFFTFDQVLSLLAVYHGCVSWLCLGGCVERHSSLKLLTPTLLFTAVLAFL